MIRKLMIRSYIIYCSSGAAMWFGGYCKLVIIQFIFLVFSFENVAEFRYLRTTLTNRKVKLSLRLML
jgi:hypothetical protein